MVYKNFLETQSYPTRKETMFSIRILNLDGSFQAYLSHNGRTQWSKRQAQRHVKEAKMLSHFVDCTFVHEEA